MKDYKDIYDKCIDELNDIGEVGIKLKKNVKQAKTTIEIHSINLI